MLEMEEAVEGLTKVIRFLNTLNASEITMEVDGVTVKVSIVDRFKKIDKKADVNEKGLLL